MTSKLQPIAALYNDATKLHYQIHKYCKIYEYKPSKQDFTDLHIIRKTIKDIEYLTLVLEEFWIEKEFIGKN